MGEIFTTIPAYLTSTTSSASNNLPPADSGGVNIPKPIDVIVDPVPSNITETNYTPYFIGGGLLLLFLLGRKKSKKKK